MIFGTPKWKTRRCLMERPKTKGTSTKVYEKILSAFQKFPGEPWKKNKS